MYVKLLFKSIIIIRYLCSKNHFPYKANFECLFSCDATGCLSRFFCGATLISPQYAISAAHCFWNDTGPKKNMSAVEVVAGAYEFHDVYGRGENSKWKRKIQRLIKPYEEDIWNATFNVHPDVVILELQKPFDIIEGLIQPACLPSKPVKPGARCFSSGFGNTEG